MWSIDKPKFPPPPWLQVLLFLITGLNISLGRVVVVVVVVGVVVVVVTLFCRVISSIAQCQQSFENTILSSYKIGTSVNIEMDMVGKYIENFSGLSK